MAGGKAVAKEGEKVAGGFLKKMLGKLIRPAKKIVGRGGADATRTAAKDGVSAGSEAAGKKLTKEEGWKLAREARDGKHDELIGKWKKAEEDAGRPVSRKNAIENKQVVTGATDLETGVSKAGTNVPAGKGGAGCAEDDALAAVNKERAAQGKPPLSRDDPNVVYSEARGTYRDGHYQEKPICERNCQQTSNKDQYPPGTQWDSPGPWDNQ